MSQATDTILRVDAPQAPEVANPSLTINEFYVDEQYFKTKYAIDRILGGTLLIPAALPIAFFWLLVRLTSRGPGFYCQCRVGLNGKTFQVIKLRSMCADAEASGQPQWCGKEDRRVTLVGRFMRKLHIDELPQLWNVVRGEMSLVGPRPERPEITQFLEQIIPHYHLRHRVKPGVTGLAQVNLEPDKHINITRQKQILDLRYIAQANPFLDARMLAATALRMVCFKGDVAMRIAALKQTITENELVRIGYQFDTPEEELWNPTKGLIVAQASSSVQTHVRFTSNTSAATSARLIPSRPTRAITSRQPLEFHADIPNAFTVDVEDYFQVSAFERRVSRKNWEKYESRVEANTSRLLSLLARHHVTGTFFILGWIAERYPGLVQRIHQAGHEIASHGYWHRLIYNQTPEDFAMDLLDSRSAIGEACGVDVTAYRAPSFSITNKSLWALDILAEKGFTVDSSIFPIGGHDRYGISGGKHEIHDIHTEYGTITEFPPSVWQCSKLHIPVGGGYFRIFPYALSRRALAEVRKQARPGMFYTHPWEIDPHQPRIAGVGLKSRFRHYTGQHSTHNRMEQMFRESNFSSMSEVIRQWSLQNMQDLPNEAHLVASKSEFVNIHSEPRIHSAYDS